MNRRHFLRTVASGGMLWAGCREPVEKPNVILLLADDQRHDTIRALGNGKIDTPHLDRLAGQGVAFTTCFVDSPVGAASRAALLTGRTGFENGVRETGQTLRAGLTTLPRVLSDAGYQTFFTGVWDQSLGERGFHQEENVSLAGEAMPGFAAERIAKAAADYIAASPREPYFCLAAFPPLSGTQAPPAAFLELYRNRYLYLPRNFLRNPGFDHPGRRGDVGLEEFTSEEQGQAALSRYYARISHFDAQVGRIARGVEDAGQAGRTVVVFTSSRGLALGSHGLAGSRSLYDHCVRTPLIVADPRLRRPGVRVSGLCHQHDLLPTLCDLTGTLAPSGLSALSLAPAMNDPAGQLRELVFSSCGDSQRMARGSRWKLVTYSGLGKRQLFDVAADPDELIDLSSAPEWSAEIDRLQARLIEHFGALGDSAIGRAET